MKTQAPNDESSDLRQPGVELERRANRRFAATTGSAMGAALWLQVEMAARGCVSGTLREWPMLAAAMRELGHNLPPTTTAETLRNLARAAVRSPNGESSDCA